MPYLEYLFCEDCGDYVRLDLDPIETIRHYNKDGRKETSIVQATFIWDYLIYSCEICRKKYKYTYKDVEKRVREYFSSLSQEHKEYFDAVVERARKNSIIDNDVGERVRDQYSHK